MKQKFRKGQEMVGGDKMPLLSAFKKMASRYAVTLHQVGMCAGSGVDSLELGAGEMLAKQ